MVGGALLLRRLFLALGHKVRGRIWLPALLGIAVDVGHRGGDDASPDVIGVGAPWLQLVILNPLR